MFHVSYIFRAHILMFLHRLIKFTVFNVYFPCLLRFIFFSLHSAAFLDLAILSFFIPRASSLALGSDDCRLVDFHYFLSSSSGILTTTAALSNFYHSVQVNWQVE